jgi:hypothetical protein
MVSFTTRPLYPQGKSPRIGGWVDPRAGLDYVEKRKFLAYRNSKSDPSIVQSVASRYTDCAIPAPEGKPVVS